MSRYVQWDSNKFEGDLKVLDMLLWKWLGGGGSYISWCTPSEILLLRDNVISYHASLLLPNICGNKEIKSFYTKDNIMRLCHYMGGIILNMCSRKNIFQISFVERLSYTFSGEAERKSKERSQQKMIFLSEKMPEKLKKADIDNLIV